MRAYLIALVAATALAACGKSDERQLQDAANQSDPAAAAVLNNAAEAGVPPQEALEQAGQAAAQSNGDMAPPSAQARPNERDNPNPPRPGQPPEKVTTNSQ